MRRCEDEKMLYRPPLLEEPCAQTLSGKNKDPKLNGEQRPLGFGARQFAAQKIFRLGAGFRPPFSGSILNVCVWGFCIAWSDYQKATKPDSPQKLPPSSVTARADFGRWPANRCM